MTWILDKFSEANGVILATPVYYYNVSAQMKTFIDRNNFLYEHDHKYKAKAVGIIIVAGEEGIEDTLHTLKQFTGELGVKEDRIFIASGYAGKLGDVKNNLLLVEASRKLGRQMVQCLKDSALPHL